MSIFLYEGGCLMPSGIKDQKETQTGSLGSYWGDSWGAAGEEKEYLFVRPEDIGLFHIFSQEGPVILSGIQSTLMLLKAGQRADIQQLYRWFHILRAQWGFLGFYQMRQLCGTTENLLEPFLSTPEIPSDDYLDSLLKVMASCRLQVDRITRGLSMERVEVWDAEPVLSAMKRQATELNDPSRGVKPVEGLAEVFVRALHDENFFKIHDEQMEELLQLLGDLTMAQATFLEETPGKTLDGKAAATAAHMGKTTKKIRDLFLSLRLVSCRSLFEQADGAVQRFSWMAEKKIQLAVEGMDVPVDRPLLPALSGALLQLLKNAVEHGIEPEAERLAVGKPAAGKLRLKATQQAGYFLLEVEDDGRGLDLDKLKKKGMALGILRDEKAPDSRVMEMIFKPGVTTGTQEGRGVGLDQVETLVEALHGSIRVQSRAGQGCKFLLKFPKSQSLIEGWVVEAGKKEWILPISQVWKITHPTPSVTEKALPPEEASLPALDLGKWLGEEEAESPKFSVHVESGSRQFRIMVDEVKGKQQVLIKKRNTDQPRKPGILGEAILSNGNVGFILDTGELVKLLELKQQGEK
jgi:two-component system chemotaxis sensor kinase CheA